MQLRVIALLLGCFYTLSRGQGRFSLTGRFRLLLGGLGLLFGGLWRLLADSGTEFSACTYDTPRP